jgi:hypothetical protein
MILTTQSSLVLDSILVMLLCQEICTVVVGVVADYGYRGHMHADDPNIPIDYSRHGFPKESAHFGSVGYWCFFL